MIMRLGGGVPLSERQRAERAFPSSVQATTGQAMIHDYGIQTGNSLPISRAVKCKPADMPMVRPVWLSGILDWRPWIATTIGSSCNTKAIRGRTAARHPDGFVEPGDTENAFLQGGLPWGLSLGRAYRIVKAMKPCDEEGGIGNPQ